MKKPYDNLFVYYRGPSSRDDESVGKQLEDNTTKAFLNVLEKSRDSNLAHRLVRDLLPPAAENILQSESKLNFRTQVRASDSDLRDREAFLLGLSNGSKSCIPATKLTSTREGTATEDSGRRYDAVVEIDDDHALVIEVKTLDDGYQKVEEYASLLGITNHDQYDFKQWAQVDRTLKTIEKEESDATVTGLLINDFRELLQYNAPSRKVKSQRYNEDGENTFEIERGAMMKEATRHAESRRVPLAMKIDITGRSEEIYFTPKEWEVLVSRLPDKAVEAFIHGDFTYFKRKFGEERCRHILAQIGESPEPRKLIQVSESKGRVVVGYRRRGEDADTWQGRYPMMVEWEFEKFYGGEGDNGLTEAECRQLFEDGDFDALLPSEWRETHEAK